MARWRRTRGRAWDVTVGEVAATEGDDRAPLPVPDGIAHLFPDESAAHELWKDRLSNYVDLQGTLDALRLRPSTEPPWPAAGNPRLAYLEQRTVEIADTEGIAAAISWLAANAWFEGAITERSRFVRLLDAD